MKNICGYIKIGGGDNFLGNYFFIYSFKFQSVIAVSKHLCGAATDLALNALVNFLPNKEPKSGKESQAGIVENPLLGLMIALCCHHRCDWRTFAGKKYLLETVGFTRNEFTLLCGLTSWAVCGSGKPRNKGTAQ